MEYLYLASCIVALGLLLWLKIFDVRNSTTQFLTVLIVLISNLGFYFVSTAASLDEAILAQKINYVGGIFLPIFYFLLVMEICHIRIKRSITVLLILFQCVLYGLVCTIGRSSIFYADIGFHMNNGILILDKVYGPLHILYPITMCLYLAGALSVAIYSVVKNKSVNRRSILIMVFLASIATGAYFVEKIIDFEYEILPFINVILMIAALIPIYDSNLFTAYENTEVIQEQLNRIGFLTFDTKMRYKGCDDYMVNVFPELAKFRVGEKINSCSDELQKVVSQIPKLEKLYNDNPKTNHLHIQIEPFLLEDKYYTGLIHGVTNVLGFLKGYTIELRDDTEHYKVLEFKEHYNEELANEVHAKTKRIRAIQQKTIIGMARMVESRDLSTGGHIKRTSDVVRIFAKKLAKEKPELEPRFLRLVIRSAPMHDLGKIGVDDAVLRKQGRFTDEEYNAMKKHSEIGFRMVREVLSDVEEPDFVQVAENVAHYHHEKVNGTGYPEGLKGDEIPVEARIMALADVFDALVSKRCYKEAFSYDKAFSIIESDAGSHFDAELAKVFLSCRPELEDYYNKSEE